MSILLIGVNHKSGPLDVLERISLGPDEVPKAVDALAKRDNIREVVVLSTCNRTEIYAVTEKFHGAYADVRGYLCDLGGLAEDELRPHLYAEHDDAAVRHLFEVAAGLDSAIVGESEILGQVRDAWKIAQAEGAARTTLNLLFRHALQIGKRARTKTEIGRGTASVSHAAVEMAREHHGDLDAASIVVVGAGTMGSGIAVALRSHGVGQVTMVTRNPDRDRPLAERVDGTLLGFDQLTESLAHCDVLLTGTGASQPVITAELVSGSRSSNTPMLVVDVGVPRDVEPAVADIDGVTVLNLDDLSEWADRGHRRRLDEVNAVRDIVAEGVDEFAIEVSAMQAGPLIAALRERAESLRQAELDRHTSDLSRLTEADRELFQMITRRMIAKLLHEPSVRLREQAGTPQGERNAAAVTDLFDLD